MDELDLILMDRLEEAERIDRFQSYLRGALLQAELEDCLLNMAEHWIETRDWEDMLRAKQLIEDNTDSRSMHRKWIDRLKDEGVYLNTWERKKKKS